MSDSGSGEVRRLGRYHLTSLGRGGPLGEVYKGRVYGVAGFEREFAIKCFHSNLVNDPDVSKQLGILARKYAGVEHARVARLHEFGVAEGETYTAVDWVDGADLGRFMDRAHRVNGAVPLDAGLALLSHAARAVGFAHGKGVQHSGICPTNLICTLEGDVRVTDFGLIGPRLLTVPTMTQVWMRARRI